MFSPLFRSLLIPWEFAKRLKSSQIRFPGQVDLLPKVERSKCTMCKHGIIEIERLDPQRLVCNVYMAYENSLS